MDIIKLAEGCLYAGFPAVGFGMVFNVPMKHLKFCALGGVLGYIVRYILLSADIHVAWCTFVAAACVSFYGVAWGKFFAAHPKVITVASVIFMVPGVYAYKAVVALINLTGRDSAVNIEILYSAVQNGLLTAAIFGALALGLAIPGLVYFRNRPVV